MTKIATQQDKINEILRHLYENQNKEYSIVYLIRGKKPLKMKFKAGMIGHGFLTLCEINKLSFTNKDILLSLKEILNPLLTMFFTIRIDKQLFESDCKYHDKELISMIRRSEDKNSDIYPDVMNAIAAYLFIKLYHNYPNFDKDDVLCIEDTSTPDDILLKIWKDHPTTKQLNIKSFEEFKELTSFGYLRYDWKKESDILAA